MDVEVAVVGGGPAGSIAAATLASAGCRVALIDAGPRRGQAVGETVSPRFVAEVSRWLPWDREAAALGVPSFGNRSAWGSDVLVSHSFLGSPHGQGAHLDRDRFDARLREVAVEAGASPVLGVRVRALVPVAGGVRLELSRAPEAIHTRALVDATGRHAWLARRLGATRRICDRLVGVVAQHDGCDLQRQCFTQIEATRRGWWFTAPLPRGRFSVAWMTDADLLGPPRALARTWAEQLSAAPHTTARLSGTTRVGPPRTITAVSQRCRATRGVVPWLGVGDAALAVDPLSGSGILRAMQTGREGAQALLRALEGDAEAIEAHQHELDQSWDRYLEERRLQYAAETRYRGATFWRRRAPEMARAC